MKNDKTSPLFHPLSSPNWRENYFPVGQNLEIKTYPHSILTQIAKPVTNFDDNLAQLCQNMLFTMYQAPGIGLAAPQVGVSLRVFVMDIDYEREQITKADGTIEYQLSNFNPHIFINPTFTSQDGQILYQEGCLSVPGIYEEVERAEEIVVNYFDLNGNSHSLEAHGLFSVCIQHENDHLNGIVFLDRLSKFKGNFLKQKLIKQKKKRTKQPPK